MGTHVEAMQNSSGSAFCLPPSLIFLHGVLRQILGGLEGGRHRVCVLRALSNGWWPVKAYLR